MAEETDERFVDRFLRNNNPHLARLWLDLAGSDDDYAPFGVRCENGRFVIVKNEQPAAAIAGIIDKAIPTSSGGFFMESRVGYDHRQSKLGSSGRWFWMPGWIPKLMKNGSQIVRKVIPK